MEQQICNETRIVLLGKINAKNQKRIVKHYFACSDCLHWTEKLLNVKSILVVNIAKARLYHWYYSLPKDKFLFIERETLPIICLNYLVHVFSLEHESNYQIIISQNKTTEAQLIAWKRSQCYQYDNHIEECNTCWQLTDKIYE